jgi:hypothetical protein
MKNFRFFALCAVLLSALFAGSCGGVYGDYKAFDRDLRGTWVSIDTSRYSGALEIDFDRITITGYGRSQTPLWGDDNERPFKDYPKGVPLSGYSEGKKIFIDYGGAAQKGIPYYYFEVGSYPKYKILEFNFGEWKEILQFQK